MRLKHYDLKNRVQQVVKNRRSVDVISKAATKTVS